MAGSIYTHRDSNIRKTFALFFVFLLIVIGIGWFFSFVYNSPGILVIAVIFSSVMSLVSYWYSDRIVLGMAGARLMEKQDNPELYRLVENLAITAGLPAPKIYLIPEEQPNAFATGRDPQHSVVAVTSGLLQRLNKTELEAVLAHELSHIGNRDMLIGTVAVVLVGFITIFSDFFRRSLFFRRRDDREGGGILIILGLVFSILAPIAALLMQLAISRRRESLADASAVLLTRYPEGLISALEKISADPTPMPHASSATAHLWLADPFKNGQTPFMMKLFMTHPPIEDRIKALKGI